jgi:hypothetical protein
MARIDDYLQMVADPSAADALVPGHPADDALIALLAAVAFSDGSVDDSELEFLLRLFPGRDPAELRDWAIAAGETPLDIGALAGALPSNEERWAGLRFAARMAWKDGILAEEEMTLLESLSDGLGLPQGALDRVIAETMGQSLRPVDTSRVRDCLSQVKWKAVLRDDNPCSGPLSQVVPKDVVGIARIGLEQVETLGFYDKGLAGRFREGLAFLPWTDIVAYSRVPMLGASVVVRTESGHKWTLVDGRLTGLVAFLDRLFGVEDKPRTTQPPVIHQTRGN